MSQPASWTRGRTIDRLGQRLDRIAKLADILRQNRGDTEWEDHERRIVDGALAMLESLPLHRGGESEEDWS